MAIINEEELNRRLGHVDNIVNVLKLHGQGRKLGDKNHDPKLRLLAGILGNLGPGREVAKNLGISESQVSQYKRGNNAAGYPDEELKAGVEDRLVPVKNTAVDIMMSALGQITPEKIEKLKVRNAALLAKDMSIIVKNTSKEDTDKAGVTFNIYAPQVKTDKDYEVIEVEKVVE